MVIAMSPALLSLAEDLKMKLFYIFYISKICVYISYPFNSIPTI